MSDTAQGADEPRTRSRLQLAATRSHSTTPVGQKSPPQWGKRGAEADAAAEAQRKRQEQLRAERARERRIPRRFSLNQEESADVIILERDFGMQIKEHEKWDEVNRRYVFESCCGEWAHCPICEDTKLGRGSRHGFRGAGTIDLISVLDLRQFRVTRGPDAGRLIQATRKPLALKETDREQFKKLQKEHGDAKGSMRGLHVLMHRDSADTTGRVGHIVEVIGRLSDEDLIAEMTDYELMGEYRDEEGVLVRAAGEIVQPFPWEELYPAPSSERLIEKYGGAPIPGSRLDNRRGASSSEWGDLDPGLAPETDPGLPLAGGEDNRPAVTEAGAGRTRLRRRSPEPQDQMDEGRFAPPDDGSSYGGPVALDDDIPF